MRMSILAVALLAVVPACTPAQMGGMSESTGQPIAAEGNDGAQGSSAPSGAPMAGESAETDGYRLVRRPGETFDRFERRRQIRAMARECIRASNASAQCKEIIEADMSNVGIPRTLN